MLQTDYKRACEYCEQPKKLLTDDNSLNEGIHYNSQLHIQKYNPDDDILIQPCYCNVIVHRECLKQSIIRKKRSQCPECSAIYQAVQTDSLFAQSFSRSKTYTILMKAILNIFGTVVISLAMYYVLSIETYLLYDSILQLITLTLAALSCCLMLIYVCLLIVNYYIRSVIHDIRVLCYQNEARMHNDQPIVALFLEKLKHSGMIN